MNPLYFAFICLVIASCTPDVGLNEAYPNDSRLSDSKGTPQDSSTQYLPFTIKIGNSFIATGIDTLAVQSSSELLYLTEEPVLSNYYLGHNQYRFLWRRSFDRPVVISLHQQGQKVWLSVKLLSATQEFIDRTTNEVQLTLLMFDNVEPSDSVRALYGKLVFASDSLIERKIHINIIEHPQKELSTKEWTRLEQLLRESNFWQEKPYVRNEDYKDGSNWIIEAHLKKQYRFMYRHSGYLEEKYRKCGEYLIKLADLPNESVY